MHGRSIDFRENELGEADPPRFKSIVINLSTCGFVVLLKEYPLVHHALLLLTLYGRVRVRVNIWEGYIRRLITTYLTVHRQIQTTR